MQIVDPFGKAAAYAAGEQCVLTHAADLQEVLLRSRTEGSFGLNLLQDRRPEHYGALVGQGYRRTARP